MRLDKETGEQMARGTKIRDFVKSDAWGEIKGEITQRLVDLADITTLSEAVDPIKMLEEIRVRKLAISLVMGWLREIEGRADQHESNEEAFRVLKEESVIVQY